MVHNYKLPLAARFLSYNSVQDSQHVLCRMRSRVGGELYGDGERIPSIEPCGSVSAIMIEDICRNFGVVQEVLRKPAYWKILRTIAACRGVREAGEGTPAQTARFLF